MLCSAKYNKLFTLVIYKYIDIHIWRYIYLNNIIILNSIRYMRLIGVYKTFA